MELHLKVFLIFFKVLFHRKLLSNSGSLITLLVVINDFTFGFVNEFSWNANLLRSLSVFLLNSFSHDDAEFTLKVVTLFY